MPLFSLELLYSKYHSTVTDDVIVSLWKFIFPRSREANLEAYLSTFRTKHYQLAGEFTSFGLWLNSSGYDRVADREDSSPLPPRISDAHASVPDAALYRFIFPFAALVFLCIRGETRLSGISPKPRFPDMYTRRLQKLGETYAGESDRYPGGTERGTEAVIPGYGRAPLFVLYVRSARRGAARSVYLGPPISPQSARNI